MARSLRALFESGGLATQESKCFSGEMEGTGQEDGIRSGPSQFQGAGERRGNRVLESRSNGREDLCDGLRLSAPLAANSWQHDIIADRRQCPANALHVFVVKNRENNCGALFTELVAPGFGEDLGSGRVVRAVDDGSFVPALEAGWPADILQTLDDRFSRRPGCRRPVTQRWRAKHFAFGGLPPRPREFSCKAGSRSRGAPGTRPLACESLFSAAGSCPADTTGICSLIMPAFSPAISSRLLPNQD